MPITDLYSDYFQKSKAFLFPALGMKRTDHSQSIITFVSWKDRYTVNDKRLIALKTGDINEGQYRQFEKMFLLNNVLFENMMEIDQKTIAYIFNYETFKDDWDSFLKGKYSKFSITLKDRIKNYFGAETQDWAIAKSFLYPNRFFELYAELLKVDVSLLREVGELCDKYDPELETFKVITKNIFDKV
jgi:hypothetical protein